MEEWKNGRMEWWKNETIRQCDNSTMEDWNGGMVEWWNVEALAEIPLRREKIGMVEYWNNGRTQLMRICNP
jgi:hypothetical protein